MQFHEKRRQQFLSETAFTITTQFFTNTGNPGYLQTLHASDTDPLGRSLIAEAIADGTFRNHMLRYTAGESLDVLRENLTEVIKVHEQSTKYVREYQHDSAFPPLRFAEIDDYERAMQLIGLCYLLHRRDLLPRLAAMLDGAFAGKDTLYEDLFAYELKDRYEVDEWYHDAPYRNIINSFYRDTAEESIRDIEAYLKAWYKSMKKAPWHDSHLSMNAEGCGAYFGYWAIEAAAAVYLLELDDRSFRDHIVYPKDLLDYARKLDKQAPLAPSAPEKLRVEGGNPCPQTGYWFTPAIPGSLRHFEQGEIMPVSMDSQYGATIWQWSSEQLPL
ncbi:PoNe immunity protein domain-containing protein [Janthinobacterium sp. RA13]|uniref:PoNe immunity protein domain-containing protein n=1 Tax=Janthinobacterium sp. RA13 TaxID=1502762 RepID=UPI00056CCBCB|nr:PoNe immunity protein domain-containing protein [Janthinobacterium sp. RA13]